jgi:hypothetical protein
MESLEEGKKLRDRELELSTAGADQSNGSTPHTAFRQRRVGLDKTIDWVCLDLDKEPPLGIN